jgi:gliding motility-associated-like protein
VGGNDDFCNVQSEVAIISTAGTVYYIYVYGTTGSQGVFTLNTTCVPPPTPPVNDNCQSATTVTVNTDGTCALISSGTIEGATQSPQANTCVGTANDDVWYQFIATQTVHTIALSNVIGSTTNLNHALFTSTDPTNPCANLTLVYCSDPNNSFAQNLTAGQTYYIRIYSSGTAILQNTSFDLCVSVPPPPPVNDSCATPLVAPVNTSLICTNIIAGTITSATASPEPNTCAGTDDDDVWFVFTALASIHNISLNNIVGTTNDLAFAVYSGPSCSALTQINCQINNSGIVGGLTPGQTYYLRVYSEPSTPNLIANFNLCITTPTQCDSAQLTCGDGSVINNQIGVPSYGAIGCLFTTPNPFWFTIEIEVSGPITFTLNQTSTGNSDVDFILWGPFTDAQINTTACNNLYDYPDGNTTIPNNVIDCSYSAAATEFIDIPNAIAGQHYLLLVTNFGNALGTFNINQTGGTGAAACCDVDLGADVVLCNATSHTINANLVGNPGTIIWFKDNVLIPNQTTASLTVTETGIYKCNITCGQTMKTDEVLVTFNTIVVDDKNDVTSCDSYTLPNDLSANNSYYTQPDGPSGTGVLLTPGAVITTSQTIYIYAQNPTTPSCTAESSFSVSIVPTPTLAPQPDVTVCNNYVLPALAVGNYFTGTNGTGTLLPAGTTITSTQTICVFAANGSCSAEECFSVTINSIQAPTQPNVTVCDSFVLPTLSVGGYFSQPNGVGPITSSTVTSSQTIYIFAQTNTTPNCTSETSFTVTVNATPTVSTLPNVTGCGTYTLPAITSGNYFTQPNGGGTPLAAGFVVTSNQTIYIYAQTGTTPNCFAQTSFAVTIINVTAEELDDVEACGKFILPMLSSGNNYYTGPGGTGTMLASGAEITATQTIYIYKVEDICNSESSFVVTIESCTIPKGISPNGDGSNDSFDLSTFGVKQLEIFNRYGIKVYSRTDYTNQWSGQTDKGDELPDGTYYYVIKLDTGESQTGWIYINRER